MTMYRLAKQIDVSASTLTQIANGISAMSPDVLVRCCDALQCAVGDIITVEPSE